MGRPLSRQMYGFICCMIHWQTAVMCLASVQLLSSTAVTLCFCQVRELKKRQQKEREKEVHQREKQLDKEKAERAAQAKQKMEQQAYELQVW